MKNSEFVNVAIIGCGLIGSDWDRLSSLESPPLTHARAFSENKHSKLVALCDTNEEKVRSAAKFWNVKYFYTDPENLFANHQVDLLIIATSSSARLKVIQQALAVGIKFFVIEKPLALTLAEAQEIVSTLKAAGAHCLVNYSRNWDPSMHEVKKRIAEGHMGRVQRVVGTYGKGIVNNGSHLIDLTGALLCARPFRVRSLDSPLKEDEAVWSLSGERALDAQVDFINDSGEIYNLMLIGTDQRAFTCFELRVIGHKAIFNLSMGGRSLSWTSLQDDPNYAGYVVPAVASPLTPRYLESMTRMADEAISLARGYKCRISCDANRALRTAMAVVNIQLSAASNGQWISLDQS